MSIKKHSSYYLLPILIIITGILLRLYRLSELFHFTYDEEVFAFVGKRMFVNGHIPLIGGVTPMHVHVAPYFYWLSGVFLFVSKLNPIGWGVAAAMLAGITILVLYITAEKIFNYKVALITILLYSFSFYQNIFNRHYWGLVFDGLISLITYFSLFQIIRGKQKYLYLLAASLSFGIHTDLSTLTLFLFTGIVLILFKPKVSQSIIKKSAIIFLLSFLPLVIFDLRHNFVNSKGILQYVEEVKQGRVGNIQSTPLDVVLYLPRTLARSIYVFGDTDLARQYSYCPHHAIGRLHDVPDVVSLVVLGLILFSVYKAGVNLRKKGSLSKRELGVTLIGLIFLATYTGVSIYGLFFNGDLFDHYLATLFPIFLLVVGYLLDRLRRRTRGITFIIIIIYILANSYLLVNSSHRFGHADKVNAVQWAIAIVGDTDFSLDVIGDCFRYNGYRYLFYLYGKEPTKSYLDANFTHLFDNPPAFHYPSYHVVITNPDFDETAAYYDEYNLLRKKLLTSTKFGEIEVLIVDNSQIEFQGKF